MNPEVQTQSQTFVRSFVHSFKVLTVDFGKFGEVRSFVRSFVNFDRSLVRSFVHINRSVRSLRFVSLRSIRLVARFVRLVGWLVGCSFRSLTSLVPFLRLSTLLKHVCVRRWWITDERVRSLSVLL